jgi:hypothetical protein
MRLKPLLTADPDSEVNEIQLKGPENAQISQLLETISCAVVHELSHWLLKNDSKGGREMDRVRCEMPASPVSMFLNKQWKLEIEVPEQNVTMQWNMGMRNWLNSWNSREFKLMQEYLISIYREQYKYMQQSRNPPELPSASLCSSTCTKVINPKQVQNVNSKSQTHDQRLKAMSNSIDTSETGISEPRRASISIDSAFSIDSLPLPLDHDEGYNSSEFSIHVEAAEDGPQVSHNKSKQEIHFNVPSMGEKKAKFSMLKKLKKSFHRFSTSRIPRPQLEVLPLTRECGNTFHDDTLVDVAFSLRPSFLTRLKKILSSRFPVKSK